MIACPACGQWEYEGTLFCAECGARLWLDKPDEEIQAGMRDLVPAVRGAAGSRDRSVPGVPRQIRLRVRGHPSVIVLSGKEAYRLGRAGDGAGHKPELDLTEYRGVELGVSREHLVLRPDETGVLAVDQGSSNGTRVNGKRIAAQQPQRLSSGDELRLGKLVLRVYFDE